MRFEKNDLACHGYIPDEVQTQSARKQGVTSDREQVLSKAVPWDDADIVPPVVEWNSLKERLEKGGEQADESTFWWENCDVEKLFTPSQGTAPNCAGFAMANAWLIQVLWQIQKGFSEQKAEKINPMVTWQLSKNGSRWGGQTISSIMRYGNELGNFPASVAGEYSSRQSFRSVNEEWKKFASERQLAFSLYTGEKSDLADFIIAAQKHHFAVVIGNGFAVADGTTIDSNGVATVQISRTWSHATCFGGYQKVNGTQYVFWVNSHGNRYPSDDGTPAFGGWMSRDALKQYCSSTFCDAAFLTYAEAPYNQGLTPTLTI